MPLHRLRPALLMAQVVTATYRDPARAEAALALLEANGIPRAHVRVETTRFDLSPQPGLSGVTGAPSFALVGAGVGGAIGGLVGLGVSLGWIPLANPGLLGTLWFAAVARGIIGGGGLGLIVGFVLGLGYWGAEEEPAARPDLTPVTLLSVEHPDSRVQARTLLWKTGADQISG
ncbi:MAG: hypothetical protein KC645_15105 [Gemmatimonadetes bacterium]|nr:hypothetical protein [Gemmatimonadota bacterium]